MGFAISVIVTILSIVVLQPLSGRLGLVDIPGGRKKHVKHVPLIGGISIFIGLCFGLLWLDIPLGAYRGLLIGSGILLLVGLVDDSRELSPKVRLAGQLLATLCLTQLGHMSVTHLGNLFFLGDIDFHKWAIVLTFMSVLLFLNAVNMIDGHDGLAGSVVLGQLLYLLPLSFRFGGGNDAVIIVLVALLLFVFLLFNFPLPWRRHAVIFLGDAGSTFLGFFVAWFAVSYSQSMLGVDLFVPGYNLVTILWILAYPLFDFLAVFFHRLCQKRSPFMAGREHLHHLLVLAGFRSAYVTLSLLGLSVTFGGVGFALAKLKMSESWQLQIYLATFVFYLIGCNQLRKKEKVVACN